MVFDGSSLDKWKVKRGDPSSFSIVESELHVRKIDHFAYIYLARDGENLDVVNNFEIKMQVRGEGLPALSSVHFHAKLEGANLVQVPRTGAALDISSGGKALTGSIWGLQERQRDKRIRHEILLRVEDATATCWIDGTRVMNYTETKPKQAEERGFGLRADGGLIGISAHSEEYAVIVSRIEFREL